MQTLSSDQRPAPGAHGLTLAPFRGVRYASDRVSGIANVTSPPYDVIGPGTVERLLESEPHNVVRLILPGARSPQSPHGPETSQLAARDLYGWLASGVLVRDPEPALYAYEQSVPANGGDTPGTGGSGVSRWEVLQRGLIGALRLVPAGSPSVLPHEDVMPGPVEGRRELMETAQANLEPIFLLYDSGEDGGQATGGPGSQATRLVDEAATTREPILSAVTDDGIRHRVWALTDPAEHAAISADLARRSALIADGHHRYETALAFHRENPALPGADRVMMTFVNMHSPGLKILATHRVVGGIPNFDPGEFIRQAAAGFEVAQVPSLEALQRAWAESPDRAIIGAAIAARLYLIEARDSAGQLDVAILHDRLLRGLLGIGEEAVREEKNLRYVRGLDAAVAEARSGAAQIAFLLKPVSVDAVARISFGGGVMPQKSTDFYPKLLSGLTIYRLES